MLRGRRAAEAEAPVAYFMGEPSAMEEQPAEPVNELLTLLACGRLLDQLPQEVEAPAAGPSQAPAPWGDAEAARCLMEGTLLAALAMPPAAAAAPAAGGGAAADQPAGDGSGTSSGGSGDSSGSHVEPLGALGQTSVSSLARAGVAHLAGGQLAPGHPDSLAALDQLQLLLSAATAPSMQLTAAHLVPPQGGGGQHGVPSMPSGRRQRKLTRRAAEEFDSDYEAEEAEEEQEEQQRRRRQAQYAAEAAGGGEGEAGGEAARGRRRRRAAEISVKRLRADASSDLDWSDMDAELEDLGMEKEDAGDPDSAPGGSGDGKRRIVRRKPSGPRKPSVPKRARKFASSELSIEIFESEGVFNMRLDDAARHLGFGSPTSIKKAMARLKIIKWPNRTRETAKNILAGLEEYMLRYCSAERTAEVMERANSRLAHYLVCTTAIELSDDLRKVRQKVYKLKDQDSDPAYTEANMRRCVERLVEDVMADDFMRTPRSRSQSPA